MNKSKIQVVAQTASQTFMQLSPIFRAGMQAGAGALATRGYIKETETDQLVAAGMFAVSLIWSYVERRLRAADQEANQNPPSDQTPGPSNPHQI